MTTTHLLIINQHDWDLYWSNEDGWVDLGSATRFATDERDTLDLPDEGDWVSVSDGWLYNGDCWHHCDQPAWSDDDEVTCSKCQASFDWDDE